MTEAVWRELSLKDWQSRIKSGALETVWGPFGFNEEWVPAIWVAEPRRDGKPGFDGAPRYGERGRVAFGPADAFNRPKSDAWAWENDDGLIVFQHGIGPQDDPRLDRRSTYVFRPQGSALSFVGVVIPNETLPAYTELPDTKATAAQTDLSDANGLAGATGTGGNADG